MPLVPLPGGNQTPLNAAAPGSSTPPGAPSLPASGDPLGGGTTPPMGGPMPAGAVPLGPQAEGIATVRKGLLLLTLGLAQVGPHTDLGQEVAKAISGIGKHVSSGNSPVSDAHELLAGLAKARRASPPVPMGQGLPGMVPQGMPPPAPMSPAGPTPGPAPAPSGGM